MSMAKIAAKSTDLDDQYRLTAYFLEDRRRPQAVLIRPIAGIESGNLTADYLSKITASQLSAQNEEQDSWENAMRNWDLEELQNRGIQIFLEMKNFPTEGELGWTQHIEDLQELVKEMDQIQKDKDKAWEQSMDPYAHLDWLPSKATIEQIKQKKISESNTLSFLVDARRFAAAYGILWSKEFGLGLTTSFNYWAWYTPSRSAWAKGQRWLRCDAMIGKFTSADQWPPATHVSWRGLKLNNNY